ncbi:hypothetical protein [Aequorivita lipolytica]|uniref:Uncharacterized protein n=1 Tax=Aequorivita lipolytica TaxID=153267 RepID=A0A5C6YU33_9FLAO|nr:hypothetical protein [Aequorivita lipolytica]TXD70779.1 hypothetical protein ESV24_01415 [Aequorivita lipolytica]SRX49823.1 hypothetical protein AEQU2_00288 [Aequorivita lipolytica]
MARLKNDLLKLTGSMGGMSFSQDEKGTIVKLKATVSKQRILKNPRSKGTRDGMMEMGGASKAAKVLRLAFLQQKEGISDRYFSGRLNGAMRLVVGKGEGLRGQRKLDLRKNGGMLEGFEFINARPLVYSIGGIKEKPTLNPERNEVYWTSPTLNRKEQITAPKEATHFKFILGAATLSNYEYSLEHEKYLPLEPKFKTPAVFVESEPIALKQKTIAPISLNLKLTEATAIPEEVAVVSVVGVVFFRNVNGELLEIKDTGGMRVLGVF